MAGIDDFNGPGGNNPGHPGNSSIPLPGGGDTHIHPYGPNEGDSVITTRIPTGDGDSISIHDDPFGGPGDISTP